MVEVEDGAGLGRKVGVAREDSASMLPGPERVAAEPAPQGGGTDLGDETLRNHVPPDLVDREAGQGKPKAVGEFTSKCLHLDDETEGKAGFTPASGLRLQAGQSGKSKSLAPLADDLARRIESGGDEVVGQALIGKEDDLGADHITIR